MTNEEELRSKLRKIEALFLGASTCGEREAAEAALERIKSKLVDAQSKSDSVEYTFTIPDQWSRRLFIALCRRYSLSPYRYPRQRRTTIMVRAPKTFINEVLWSHYKVLSKALTEYLSQATEKIISEEIHCNTAEAQEIGLVGTSTK